MFKEIFPDFPHYFRSGDPDDLAKKIIDVLEDDTLRSRKQSQAAELRDKYSWTKTAQATLAFYNEIMENQ